ncbi:uncharacterized protein LY89DRAFT_378222 [Mollisia scopiformis]|uniref:2EXR domain-containing protein n=1 Tax=Mollisia scopiformis TaxID=149040 RepID=A0A194XMU5_MOLSC|nr:uncharacterized protein LY89DRAFT_378222 [Mollisia scopiformis]KUJ21585.1 hypothetical protein LY89DRAFT_378222 [Mollisia scopiformis]
MATSSISNLVTLGGTKQSVDTQPLPSQQTFTCFPTLPVEIRLQIWKFAAHISRNVDLHIAEQYRQPRDSYCPNDTICFYASHTRVPAVLFANLESRKESLKWYNFEFDMKSALSREDDFHRSICINWAVDRICFKMPVSRAGETKFSDMYPTIIDRCKAMHIRSLAVIVDARNNPNSHTYWFIATFRFLDEILLLADTEEAAVLWASERDQGFDIIPFPDGCPSPRMLKLGRYPFVIFDKYMQILSNSWATAAEYEQLAGIEIKTRPQVKMMRIFVS